MTRHRRTLIHMADGPRGYIENAHYYGKELAPPLVNRNLTSIFHLIRLPFSISC